MDNFICEMCLEDIMVVVFISSDWKFVSMNATTIPSRRASYRELSIDYVKFSILR